MLLLIILEIILFILFFLLFKTQNYMYLLVQFFVLILVLSTGLLFIQIEFLAFMLVLIYAGAVLILFLFVVMLFDGNIINYNKQKYLGIIRYFVIVQFIIWLYISNYDDVFEKVDNNYMLLSMYYNDGINYDIGFFYDGIKYNFSEFLVDNFVSNVDKVFIQYDDLSLFHEVSIYLFNFCSFEFCIVGLLIFICLLSVGCILKKKMVKNKVVHRF